MRSNNNQYHSAREISEAIQKVPPHKRAYMFDFDGTLVDFKKDPNKVRLTGKQRDNLYRRYDMTEGGVTIITGRDEKFINGALKSFRLPASFKHGVYLREEFGGTTRQCTGDIDLDLLKHCREQARQIHHPYGLRDEDKSHGAAFHYIESKHPKDTMDPIAHAMAFTTTRFYNERASGEKLKFVAGHMVYEMNPMTATKENAVAKMMSLEQFKDRTLIYFGDQPADQGAIDVAINQYRGIGIARGMSISKPTFRVETPSVVQKIIDMGVNERRHTRRSTLAMGLGK